MDRMWLREKYDGYVKWWTRFGPLAMGFMVLAIVLTGFLTWQATVTNGRQDRERDEARDQALRCIDDRDKFAADQSVTLRKLTQRRDNKTNGFVDATLDKEAALVDWTGFLLVALAQKTPDPGAAQEFLDKTARLNTAAQGLRRASKAFVRANVRLADARAKNPVVPPASVVCATGKFVPPKPSK